MQNTDPTKLIRGHHQQRPIVGPDFRAVCMARLVCLVLLTHAAAAADPTGEHRKSVTTAPPAVLVLQGKPKSRLVVPDKGFQVPRRWAEFLADYIRRSTGAELPIVKESEIPPDNDAVEIHVGATAFAAGLGPADAELQGDGFAILFPDDRHIVLSASTAKGLEYAVYEFLERFVGVRWLFPGELGETVPQRRDLIVIPSTVHEAPAFRMRELSGLGRSLSKPAAKDQHDWALRNRMTRRVVEFHHNLFTLFPPKLLAETHPEVYPIIDGKRHIVHARLGWQPCFSTAPTLDLAVERISNHFDTPPRNQTSYSLGVNDGGVYCECPDCRAGQVAVTNEGGVAGVVHEEYFNWCNRVAETVRTRFPDKLFGFLAYGQVEQPPVHFRLNEGLVPFLTYDRMKWCDPALARRDQTLTERWNASASALGWYDYVYGDAYSVPRVYPHLMAEYLRFGQAHGVRYYYAEAYTGADWHEGPKLYVLLKLLWNPERDVDALLDDWYRAAVGSAAAPSLARYFALWERFWTTRAAETPWFREGDTFLHFLDSGYLEAFDVAWLDEAKRLLEETIGKTTDDRERQRAQFLMDGFLKRTSRVRAYYQFRQIPQEAVSALNARTLLRHDFDKDMNGWTSWQRASSQAVFVRDTEEGRDARGSLRIDTAGSAGQPLCHQTEIEVARGRTIRLGGWCRVQGLTPSDAQVKLIVKWKMADRTWATFVPTMESQPVRLDASGWQPLAVQFRIAEDAESLVRFAVPQFTVRGARGGTVWLDDFEAAELTPAEKAP